MRDQKRAISFPSWISILSWNTGNIKTKKDELVNHNL